MTNKLVNLTPHAINFYSAQPSEGGICIATLPKPETDNAVVRVVSKTVQEGDLDLDIGGDVVSVPKLQNPGAKLGDNFPQPQDGVMYFTSRPAAMAAWAEGRTDVCCPGTPVRNEVGQQIGCIGVAFS